MNAERLEIPLTDETSLVVEADIGAHVTPFKEIFIGIEKNGIWCQDLAVVREQFHYDTNDFRRVISDHGKYEVLVYANDEFGDYTDRFEILECKEEEE